jgi:uncharacterized protein YyaL (SSP411 family)
MAFNIYHLSVLFDVPEFKKRAEKMITSLSNAIVRHPTSFGIWAGLLMEMTSGTHEIAVIGEKFFAVAKQILAEYIPHKVLLTCPTGIEKLPLLAGKRPADPPLIYLCKDYSCLNPVSTVSELMKLATGGNKID